MLVYESCFMHIPQHLAPDSLVSHSYIHQAPSGTGRREGGREEGRKKRGREGGRERGKKGLREGERN